MLARKVFLLEFPVGHKNNKSEEILTFEWPWFQVCKGRLMKTKG